MFTTLLICIVYDLNCLRPYFLYRCLRPQASLRLTAHQPSSSPLIAVSTSHCVEVRLGRLAPSYEQRRTKCRIAAELTYPQATSRQVRPWVLRGIGRAGKRKFPHPTGSVADAASSLGPGGYRTVCSGCAGCRTPEDVDFTSAETALLEVFVTPPSRGGTRWSQGRRLARSLADGTLVACVRPSRDRPRRRLRRLCA